MLLTEFQIALRRLLREPRYSALCVATLTVGIGATTATFSALDAVVLRPLPYPGADSLVSILSVNRERGIADGGVSLADYVAWRERARSFSSLAAAGYADLVLTGAGEPERVTTAAVSASFLRVLGVRPALGRDFLAEEETPGRDQIVLLSHGLWLRRFGGRRDVVGRTLRLSGDPYQVVGVMPADFRFHGPDVGFWSPMSVDLRSLAHQRHSIGVIARLRRGVGLAQAQQEMNLLAEQTALESPATDAGWGARVVPLRDKLTGASRAPLALAFGAALVVLGLAVANVANLLAARLLVRAQESMVRTAMGARRIDVVRPWLLENLILSLLGAAGGAAVARIGLRFLRAYAGFGAPGLEGAGLDRDSALLTIVVAVLVVLVLTLFPAAQRQADRGRPWTDALRGGAARRGRRVTETIAVAELSLALVLSVGSGLLLRSLWEVTRIDPGFEPRGVVVVNLDLPLTSYPDGRRQGAFFDQLLERVRLLPQVADAAESSSVPLSGFAMHTDAAIVREDAAGGGRREDRATVHLVSDRYFATLRIPLRAGRDVTERDGLRMPPVAIVNGSLAGRLWPAEPPLGRRFRLSFQGDELYEVVGVVGDVRQSGLELAAGPEVFLPYRQHRASFASLVVRARRGASAAIPALKAAVWSVDREQAVTVSTMDELVGRNLSPRRFLAQLLALFTAIAIAIAVLGVFSMSSVAAQQGLREIGIRIALGARVGEVVRKMLLRTATLTATGLGIGLVGVLLGARYLRNFVFGIRVLDPLAIVGAAAVLVAGAMCGGYLPVRRAATRDPMEVLQRS